MNAKQAVFTKPVNGGCSHAMLMEYDTQKKTTTERTIALPRFSIFESGGKQCLRMELGDSHAWIVTDYTQAEAAIVTQQLNAYGT